MTCPQSTPAGAADHPLPHSASARPLDTAAPQSGPVRLTLPMQSYGISGHITARADRLSHSNACQKERYLKKHLTLAGRIYSGVCE